MEVEYAFIADAAQVAPDNKLYALGAGIDEIQSEGFPTVLPALSLVVKLKLHATECDREHNLEIQLWDADGNRIAPVVGGPFSAARREDAPARSVYMQMVLTIHTLVLPRAGTYDFHVVVNGQHIKTVSLMASTTKAPAPEEGPHPETG